MEPIRPEDIELARLNHFTLARHHLTPATRSDDLVAIARDVGGLHATGTITPYLSLHARTRAFTRDDLDRELYERRTLAKLRCVRTTIYVHPLHAVPFVFRATSELSTRGAERFLEARGVSPAQFQDLAEAIAALLRSGDPAHAREMTTAAIKEALHTSLNVSAVLELLCDQGILIRTRPEKSWRDRRQNYALWAAYFPGFDLYAMDEQEATRRLVEHYLAAFGPATQNDVAWWTGLGKLKIRAALADLAGRVAQVAVSGLDGDLVMLRSQLEQMIGTPRPTQPVVNLLPWLDPYVMGYKDRARYLDESDRDMVFDRGGNGTSTIVVSGRAAGVWDVRDDNKPAIKLFLFRPPGRDVREMIEAEAQKMGRFILDREVDLQWCSSMVPLTRQTAGGMMAPLKSAL